MGTNHIVSEIQGLRFTRKEGINILKSRVKTKGYDYYSLEILDSLHQYCKMQKALEYILEQHQEEALRVRKNEDERSVCDCTYTQACEICAESKDID